ncbi:ParB/Srx family N-terminal domain-containing protein [Burkholderia orbicola]|uniref:ParB/Srx family N-terminal domain-containing protein n=1 Tax=Burkholderia TaxID=32008 RepID=UPI000F523B33|nr:MULTISPECIES: ParB/Srx family N-terminal domain-containing protein [Burkholderia]RQM56871.1 chromosome partitioning protein ParB [Burkholderia vietnamiensis]RQT53790.1 chromosome partitioning protein ParB [Burkholderia cepacia]
MTTRKLQPSGRKSSIAPVIGIEETKKISPDLLVFDKDNPRLMTGDEYATESDVQIISAYREIAALDELIASIETNTYIDLEPLIVMGPDSGPFTVLEGNRRLAAIKVLRDPALAAKCRVSVPKHLAQRVRNSLEEIMVYRVERRTDAEAFIGFKHINGPHRWDAYAKARFVYEWYKREQGSISIDQIAYQTGDTNNTIRDYIGALFVLEQAETRCGFDISDRTKSGRFAFSHLYTALGRKEYLEFLGLEPGWNKAPAKNPIKKIKEENLGETLLYMYGSKSQGQKALVDSQNPDLRNLGMCLVNQGALQKLRSGSTLAVAYAEVSGASQFGMALIAAEQRMGAVLELIGKYDGDPTMLNTGYELMRKAALVHDYMSKYSSKKKPKSRG